MQRPLQITFRDIRHSDAIESHIRERVDKLEHFYDRITGCRVVVGEVRRHHHQGKWINIRVDLSVPGAEIVVNRDRAEDAMVAVRDAFDLARRKLEDHVRRQRGDIKLHEPEHHGTVARLFPDDGYGFITDDHGNELYFHRYNVVHPDFDQLSIGDEVVFLVEAAEEGMQANRVSVGKHHPLE